LAAHIGAPAKPVVQEGALVKRGDVIATVEPTQLGCPVHASINGRVASISPRTIQITA
jgi:Na+-translocating ferredoxin:NAD+ oxidoreductase RnfC subunit